MDDDSVIIPQDDWENAVINCFLVSLKSGINGVEVEYLIVRDFSKKCKLDSIELYQVIKSMAGEMNG